MSDDQYDIDEDDIDPVTGEAVTQPPSNSELRRAAKDGGKAKREADNLRRELALVKAGIDTDSALGKMFAKSYDGELTSDAVKASWAELSPPADAAPDAAPEETVTDPAERASTAERTALASGASVGAEPAPDPYAEASAAAKKTINDGGTEEAALAASFATIVAAAQAGDSRVLVNSRG